MSVTFVPSIAGVLLIVAVALAVGCGDGGKGTEPGDDAAEVRAVVEAMEKAEQQGDWPELYSLFAQKCRQQCPLDEFIAKAEGWREFYSQVEIEVVGIFVEGDTATADLVLYFGGEGTENVVQFVREERQWRVRAPPGTECCEAFSDSQQSAQ